MARDDHLYSSDVWAAHSYEKSNKGTQALIPIVPLWALLTDNKGILKQKRSHLSRILLNKVLNLFSRDPVLGLLKTLSVRADQTKDHAVQEEELKAQPIPPPAQQQTTRKEHQTPGKPSSAPGREITTGIGGHTNTHTPSDTLTHSHWAPASVRATSNGNCIREKVVGCPLVTESYIFPPLVFTLHSGTRDNECVDVLISCLDPFQLSGWSCQMSLFLQQIHPKFPTG